MFRAVVSILLILPMLMPQGVCLRKFDCVGWLLRTSAPTSSHVRTERADERHPSSCRCGCQERVNEDQQLADAAPAPDFRVQHGTPPQPQEPCCPAICKSKLEKIVQVENPQPSGDAPFVGSAPAPMPPACTPPHRGPAVAVNSPPLYISFCTLLI